MIEQKIVQHSLSNIIILMFVLHVNHLASFWGHEANKLSYFIIPFFYNNFITTT